MDILKSVLYGIMEGITEWLPISSTGHLILLEELLPMGVSEGFYEMFNVVIQLGAILAVILLYFHKLNPFALTKTKEEKQQTWNLWFKVIVAVLPSAVIGLLLDDWMEATFYNHVVVAITLILYGIAFIWVEGRNRGLAPKVKNVHAITYRTALLIGAFQCLSLIPGTSRSGSTILGGIFLGVSRGAASEFSFFLAIPTMLGASALKMLKFFMDGGAMSGNEIAILLVGCLVAFLVSVAMIKGLMRFIRQNSFRVFGVYRIILGAIVILYWLCNR